MLCGLQSIEASHAGAAVTVVALQAGSRLVAGARQAMVRLHGRVTVQILLEKYTIQIMYTVLQVTTKSKR